MLRKSTLPRDCQDIRKQPVYVKVITSPLSSLRMLLVLCHMSYHRHYSMCMNLIWNYKYQIEFILLIHLVVPIISEDHWTNLLLFHLNIHKNNEKQKPNHIEYLFQKSFFHFPFVIFTHTRYSFELWLLWQFASGIRYKNR